MPQLQVPGGHWYTGEPVPGGCIPNALPIDDGLDLPWAPDVRHLWKVLQGLLAGEQAKVGGVAMAEEEGNEEQRGGPSVASITAPL